MKAMVLQKYGGPEVFEKAEVARPELKPGYVLVKVQASSTLPILGAHINILKGIRLQGKYPCAMIC